MVFLRGTCATDRILQVEHYGLHQLMLSEGALYMLTWNAAKFEGKQNKDRDTVRCARCRLWIIRPLIGAWG